VGKEDLDVVNLIDTAEPLSMEKLAQAFHSYYEPVGQLRAYEAEFTSYKRDPLKQTPTEYANKLRRKAMLAYPDFTSKQLNRRVNAAFVDGQPDRVKSILAFLPNDAEVDIGRLCSAVASHEAVTRASRYDRVGSKPIREIRPSEDTTEEEESEAEESEAEVSQLKGKKKPKTLPKTKDKEDKVIAALFEKLDSLSIGTPSTASGSVLPSTRTTRTSSPMSSIMPPDHQNTQQWGTRPPSSVGTPSSITHEWGMRPPYRTATPTPSGRTWPPRQPLYNPGGRQMAAMPSDTEMWCRVNALEEAEGHFAQGLLDLTGIAETEDPILIAAFQATGRRPPLNRTGLTCFVCDGPGHLWRDCGYRAHVREMIRKLKTDPSFNIPGVEPLPQIPNMVARETLNPNGSH
jgi:hypothetical protein